MGITKRRSRTEQNEDNRRRLLDAARKVFIAVGYHGATLDRVAEAAGFTKGVVYSRFASKAELFLELYAARTEERIAEVRSLPPAAATATIDAITRQWLTRMRVDPAWSLLVIEFRVEAARDRALSARYAAIHERLVAAFAEIVSRDVAAAGLELVVPAIEMARVGMALGTGTLLERTATHDGITDATLQRAQQAIATMATKPRRRA